MKTQTSLRTSLLTITVGASLALGACGGGETTDDNTDITDDPDIDAGTPDAGTPDAEPAGGLLSDLSDADWTALCMDIVTPELQLGQQAAFNCTDADCAASATAVEDCIADLVIKPEQCDPPPVDSPLRACDAPVTDLETCYGAFAGQFVPYGTATCENVGSLDPLSLDPATFPECDDLLAQCPNAFGQ